jgi:hypothetical protein
MTHAIKKKINNIKSKRGNSSNVTLYASFDRLLLTRLLNRLVLTCYASLLARRL